MWIWMNFIKFGGIFAAKGDFKQWDKQRFLEILDFMHVNGKLSWNMSSDKVNNLEQKVYVAGLILNWLDLLEQKIESDDDEFSANGHFPVAIRHSSGKEDNVLYLVQ